MKGQPHIDEYIKQMKMHSPPPKKRGKQLPPTPTSLFDGIEVDDDDVLETPTDEYGELVFGAPKAREDIRSNKTWGIISNKFNPKSYDFAEIPAKERTISAKQLSRFTQNLADLLINGNLRIKFSPKCATRTGAALYCKSKLDDRGYPRFKLIGTNTQDPFGNDICDMNGDKVDDIIICDKQGNPVIINGYKLVQASPYKKVWMNEKKAGKTKSSFESWLAEQFGTTKDWSKISEEEWQQGKIAWDMSKANDNAQSAYSHYVDVGLGKPRLNTRLSARALWSSLFSDFVWRGAKEAFKLTYQSVAPLIKCVNYLKLANALYVILMEYPVARKVFSDGVDWIKWVNYKQGEQKSVNKRIGVGVQRLHQLLSQEAIEYKDNDETAGPNTDNLMKQTIGIILSAFDFNNKQESLAHDCAVIEKGDEEESIATINRLKNIFKKNIDIVVNSAVPGYYSYIQQQNAHKPKEVEGFDNYMNMTWK